MHKRKALRAAVCGISIVITLFMLGGCAGKRGDGAGTDTSVETSVDTAMESSLESMSEASAESAGRIDYAALGITEYEYPNEFILGENLKGAMEQLAILYDDFSADHLAEDEYWTALFTQNFLLNSRYSFDYLRECYDADNGLLSKAQAAYIQYSLTGTDIPLDNMADGEMLDLRKSASGYSAADLLTYEADDNGDLVTVRAQIGIFFDSSDAGKLYEVTASLKKDPYSCFDGYCIRAMKREDITPVLNGDGKEHVVRGGFMELNEEQSELILELPTSDDGLDYSHFVYVDISKDSEFAKYINASREGGHTEFAVTFVFDESMTTPIEKVMAVSVEAVE
ncbi:MAG: hypothetical protein IJ747_05515 [Lachnospiraceae bacterium]|nr:hypothetical protein [Lachnospiraceae bacterium]